MKKPAQRPAPPLSHWGYAVIRATTNGVISNGVKHLVALLRELDRPDKDRDGIGGAYQEPSRLAEQLGWTVDVLKHVRTDGQRLGIVQSVSVKGSSLDFWFPRLPEGFDLIPPDRPPAGADREERRAWVQHNAARLTRFLAGRAEPPARGDHGTSERNGGATTAPPRCNHGTSKPVRGAISGGGEVQRPPLGDLEMRGNPASSVSVVVVTQECHTLECDTRSQRAKDECDTKSASRDARIATYREALAHETDPCQKHLYEVALRRLEPPARTDVADNGTDRFPMPSVAEARE